MSHLQRSFARTKLEGLPLKSPIPDSPLREQVEEEEDDSRIVPELPPDDDSSSASSASSTGTIVPSLSKRRFASHGFVQPDWRWIFLTFISLILPMFDLLTKILDKLIVSSLNFIPFISFFC